MKKILLGAFLLVSALSFSAGRKVPAGKIVMDQNTGIAYVQGEQTPFTGTVEVKFDNGKVQGLLEVKNGLLDGTGVTYYPSGKVKSKENYKNGYEEGINTIYYENGNIEYEKYVSNNGRLVYEKHFYPNGQVAQQGIFKDGVQVQ